MDGEVVNTGSIGVKKRALISDGVYLISPKNNKNVYLSINDKSNDPDSTVTFNPLTQELHQYFLIKYYEDHDYYTIKALNSHFLLGIKRKEDSQYDGSEVLTNSRSSNHFVRWQISSDNGYIFKLKNYDLCLQYIQKKKLHVSTTKENVNQQKFLLRTKETIPTGLYYINPILPKKTYITFNKNISNNSNNSFICKYDYKEDQLFYVVYDTIDGCYSIINYNMNCLSSDKDALILSKIYHSEFYNLDRQKWIIGTKDGKNYIIIHKESEFLLFNKITDNSNKYELGFTYFNRPNNNINYMYFFQPGKSKSFFGLFPNRKIIEAFKIIQEKIKFRHLTHVTSNLYNPSQNSINCHLFENSFILQHLEIPLSIVDVHERALASCSRIKLIKCDPKWLKLLPNPLNVENVIVPNGVQYILSDHFKNFNNLKNLSLPISMRFENCDKDAFSEIHGLKLFDGHPMFLKIINKDELEVISIPSFVREIPEKSCANCKLLKEVVISKDSHLKVIESKAFANCKLLKSFRVPDDVENVAPDAFDGCSKHFDLKLQNEIQKSSVVDKLIIEPRITEITEFIKSYINISSIDIHLGVSICAKDVLNDFKRLKNVKCHPKWLNNFNTKNIEKVTIPSQITELKKQNFEHLNHLKFIEIPNSVVVIEDGTFNACNELNGVKCSPSHFSFLNKEKIETLILNQEVTDISTVDFNEFVNLKSITIPSTIQNVNPESFVNCKKLTDVNHPTGNSIINNSISIDENRNEILKNDFKDWTNLETLVIPSSITRIEEGSFNDCTNLKILTCDPKWFPYIPKNSIKKVIIPDFVEEIRKGQFDEFYSMTYIKLPRYITIDDGTIFDLCESLKIIKCRSSVFSQLSEKTIERCDRKIKAKYENPIFNFQPDPSKVFDLTNLRVNDSINDSISQSITNSLFLSSSMNVDMGITLDELIAIEPDSNKYRAHIENVLNMIHNNEIIEPTQFNDTSIGEISNICGFICNKLSRNPLRIVLNIVQIYSILRLANEILNNAGNEDCKGSVAEIKPGEGKTLIITILSIIFVKYGHSIDIIASDLHRAKRDQRDQKAIFDLFSIKSDVFYDRRNDSDILTRSTNFESPDYFDQYREYDQSEFNNFNIKAFECPVVYSTNRNFEYYHLHTMFSMIPRQRDLDIVLINEVDNMLIDELDSPAVISKEVNYALSREILSLVYSNRFLRITEIVKILKALHPFVSKYKEEDFEKIKDAALEADNKIKEVDYIVDNNNVVIIDHDSGFKLPNSHWPIYVREMVEIKEKSNNNNIKLSKPSLIMCQITQQTYFKLYKKIGAVTGTLGSSTDEQVLKEGYNLNTFKVPRNILTKIEVYYKTRPDSIEDVFNLVHEEILETIDDNRPVLIIWDSKCNAENFMRSHDLENARIAFGHNQIDDELAIDSAGEPRAITISNASFGKNLDINLSRESLEAGGLHVIIPMKISNLRSFEQAVGTTGKHGQPGSVTIFIANDDMYIKTPLFNKRNGNLIRLQNMFIDHIKTKFSWMICGPGQRKFPKSIEFPFEASYSDTYSLLLLVIIFIFKEEYKDPNINEAKLLNDYADLCWITVQTAWSSFFTQMQTDKLSYDSWTYCEKAFVRFIKEFSQPFDPEISKTVKSSFDDLKSVLDAIPDEKDFIYGKRYKVSSSGVKLISINDIEFVQQQYKEVTKNDHKSKLQTIFEYFLLNTIRIPGKNLLYKTPKVNINNINVDFIKLNMILANEAYSGKFSNGNVVYASEINDKYKPKFYCVEFFNKIFVVTRGSVSDDDWVTDFMCDEVHKTFNNEIDIYFHRGFFTAANYILSNITEIIERDYDEIYFVGHSYAAAVSNVLCLITKMHPNFKDKDIYSYAFAPPPSMSKIPGHIQDCMFSFINRYDIVPHLSLNNLKNTLDLTDRNVRELLDSIINLVLQKNNCEYAHKLASYTEKYKNDLISLIQNIAGDFHIRKNIGNIFLIGVSDTTKLKNCQIDETDLQDSIFLCAKPYIEKLSLKFDVLMFDDHAMTEYIKSFSIINSY